MADRIDAPLAQAIVETITQPLLVLDAELRLQRANAAFFTHFDVSPEESLGRPVSELGNGQWNIPEFRRLLDQILEAGGGPIGEYRVDHDFETLGQRTMLLSANALRRDGHADLILVAITDITERERLLFELEGRKEFDEKLIDSIREGLLVLNSNLCVTQANETFYEAFGVTPEEVLGRRIYELGNGQWDVSELRTLLEDILPKQTSFNDFRIEHDFESVGRRTMMLNARRIDHLDSILLAIRDVSVREAEEKRRSALTGELQHRVKNILNSVRALARQTYKRSGSLDEFAAAFEARLSALARVQDLFVKGPLEPIDLHDLIRLEFAAVGAEPGASYEAEGPAVALTPEMVQPVGMVMHELTTNAVKHGALAAPNGRVRIGWSVEPKEAERWLSLIWREEGCHVPEVCPKKGFGSRVITESLPHMLGGRAELNFRPQGAECRLEFPLTE